MRPADHYADGLHPKSEKVLMTREEFDALVSKLEEQARQNPAGYRWRVVLLALMGDAYLAATVLLIFALLVGLIVSVAFLKLVAVKLIVLVVPFLWLLLKALWVRIPPPEGSEIRRTQAPALFAMIDELRARLGAPAFHHVLVTDELNAGVVQSPRLGIFGWPRNYLLLGLPLMKCLTAEQFKAVLAHEFGHLAGGHGRLSNWIYRQRLRWSRLQNVLEATQSSGAFLFKPFLNWYAPYFNGYSFPLARSNEYEADAVAARLMSPRVAAEALTGVEVVGSYLGQRFWPGIHKQADERPHPAFAPYSGLDHRLATELDETSREKWLKEAMARPTTCSDTHPALAQRLAAIGQTPRLAPPAPGQGADRLLGQALDAITTAFDRRWEARILPAWQERHREVQEGRRRLADLDARYENGTELGLQDAYERALLTESIGERPDAALEQLHKLLERAPDAPLVCLSLGARLLGRDDDAGIAHVRHAMEIDESLLLRGCQLLRDYCWRRGREEEAQAWHKQLRERSDLEQAAERERSHVYLRDKFERHGLTEDAVRELKAGLQAVPGMRKAYLVKKRVTHFADRPCYVLGYRAGGLFQWHSRKRSGEVMKRIQESVRFPGETLIIDIGGSNYRFGRKFRWMRGTRIF